MKDFAPMRRSDREMTPGETASFIEENMVGYLGTISENGYPYVIPVNYVYSSGRFIIHSALSGHKMDNIRRDGRVCMTVSQMDEIVESDRPCDYSVRYQSAVAFGRARIVDGSQKLEYLREFTRGFKKDGPEIGLEEAKRVAVLVMEIDSLTGKRGGQPVSE